MIRSFSRLAQKRFYTTAAAEKLVLLEERNGVAVVTLNQPKKLNAMSVDMAKDFGSVFEEIAHNTDKYRCVVLQGAGEAFSAGGDLKFLLDRTTTDAYTNARTMQGFYKSYLYPMIRDLDLPIISAINGHAIGAGLCISLVSDIRIVRNNALLGVTFLGLGLSPGMACTYTLPNVVGDQMAAYMMLTADTLSGDQAKECGLVLESIKGTSDDVKSRAMQIADKILQNPSTAVKLTVRSMRVRQLDQIERFLQRESDSQAQCYATPEYKARVEAMIAKSSGKKQ